MHHLASLGRSINAFCCIAHNIQAARQLLRKSIDVLGCFFSERLPTGLGAPEGVNAFR